MIKTIGTIVIDSEKCKGCEVCISVCPQNILRMSGKVNSKGYIYAELFDKDKCTGCANCGIVCPDGVITVYRTKTEI